jgi:hypothetical protein
MLIIKELNTFEKLYINIGENPIRLVNKILDQS